MPAVAVITAAFVDAAELMARACGMSQYGFAVVDHPISSARDEALQRMARETLEQAERLLLLPPAR